MNGETEIEILSSLQEIKQNIDILKEDVGTLKQDVGTLKQDVGTLNQFAIEATQRMDRMERNLNTLQTELARNSEQHVEMRLELKDIKNIVDDAKKDSKLRDEELDNKIDTRNDLIMKSLETNKWNTKRINKIETLLNCNNV